MGYTNIKIYNGGLKDWVKSGSVTEVVDALPDDEVPMVTAAEFSRQVQNVEREGCLQKDGKPAFASLDLRSESCMAESSYSFVIHSSCEILAGCLDELFEETFRHQIPRDSPAYITTETGNRDVFAVKQLNTYGYTNVSGLLFGMRGWIKADYPNVQRKHK